MNDDELITLVKEPFADVHMTMPLDQMVRCGRAVRARRRRLRGLAGAATLAAGGVAVVALLVPGGHPATAQMAAWTVSTDPDGGITVTVNQMKDPAGLQARLRADGIPARVTFDPLNWLTQPLPAGCTAPKMSDRANTQLQEKILTPPAILAYQQQLKRLKPATLHVVYRVNGQVKHATLPASPGWLQKLRKITKHAQHITVSGLGGALPRSLQKQEKEERDGLYINPAAIPAGIGLSIGVDVTSRSDFGYGVDLVVTSPQCTGS